MTTVTIHSQEIPYSVKRERRRTISISVNLDGEIEVKAPRLVPEFAIRSFITSKEEWVMKRLREVRMQSAAMPQRSYHTGDMLPFFGKQIPLTVTESDQVAASRLYYIDKGFHVFVPPFITEREKREQLRPHFLHWYMHNSLPWLEDRSRAVAASIGTSLKAVRLKEVTSIWGSCSHEQEITYNWKLALAPLPISNYVIAHEVSHLIHKHHQDSFWECVRRLDPEFKLHIRWLKRYGSTLTL